MHCNLEGAHLGFEKTYEKIRLHFHWPGMYRDIKQFVMHCTPCALRKAPVRAPAGHMMPIEANGPWDLVGVDIIGPLPITDSRNRYIIVFTDYLTKWVEAFPMRDAEASTIAEIFVNEVIPRHGAPRRLLSDRGSNFRSDSWQQLFTIL